MTSRPPPSLPWVVAQVAKRWTPEDGPHLYSAFGYTAGALIFMLTCKEYARMLAEAKKV